MLAQSTTRAAQLRVVAPVELLIITDGMGHPVPPVLPPIPEGGTLNITCTARGGKYFQEISSIALLRYMSTPIMFSLDGQ